MDITSYVIIGASVSLLVQFLKTKFGTESKMTMLIVVGLSLLGGGIYYFLKQTSFLEPFIAILGFAGAVYTYIVQKFEK